MTKSGDLIPKDIYVAPDHKRVRSMPQAPAPEPEAEESGPIYKIEPINLKRAHGPGLGIILLILFVTLGVLGTLWWLGEQHKERQIQYANQVDQVDTENQ